MNHSCVVTRRAALSAGAHCCRRRRWASSSKSRDSSRSWKPKSNKVAKQPGPAPAPPPFIPRKIQNQPPPQPETLLSVWRTRWFPLTGAALTAGALGYYFFSAVVATYNSESCDDEDDDYWNQDEDDDDDDDDDYNYIKNKNKHKHKHKHNNNNAINRGVAVPTGLPPMLTGENAEKFDNDLDWTEWWIGITSLRRRIAAQARGNVLELAVGSGRNLEYYDWSPIEWALEEEEATATAMVAAKDDVGSKTAATATAAAEKRKKKIQQLLKKKRAAGGITSYTGLDISIDMLNVTRNKLTRTVPPLQFSAPVIRAFPAMTAGAGGRVGAQISLLNGRMRLVHSDAHHALPPPPTITTNTNNKNNTTNKNTTVKKYDTIIQTFGLCSVADPVAVLSNLASAVVPGTGRIVLLEHGKGFFGLVNGVLDRYAPSHFRRYGCWWNRDIEAVVEAAVRATPGLAIVRLERPKIMQMGTLVWVELKMEEQNGVR